MKHLQWRPDIDGLRAVAVSSVVFFHAFPRQLGGGYIGVDIFFVISGFLISSIIFHNLKKKTFSFPDFYARRIRRIFPALILVMGSCYALGWHTLLTGEYEQLGKGIAGGAGFISNFVSWSNSGYFDRAAELNPLLHLWSLSIEEQFYIIWPLVLWFAWKHRINVLLVTLGVALASFIFNLNMIQKDVVAAFYSPLTRFWEILAGVALAYYMLQKGFMAEAELPLANKNRITGCVNNVLSFAGAILLILGVFLLDEDSAFPGYWAVLPVAGSVLIIAAGQKAWLNKYVLSHKVIVWIGLISYPLYLWHWPLLVFPRIIEGDEPGWPLRASAVALAVLLAWLTYRFVEIPVRTSTGAHRYTRGLSAVMILVAALGLTTFFYQGIPTRTLAQKTAEISAAHRDHSSREPSFEDGFLDLGGVTFDGKSTDAVLFLGDSLMAHYFSRVEYLYSDTAELPLFSATFAPRSGCRPVPKGATINSEGRQCDEYYASVIKLAEAPQYKRIALSASWEYVFSERTYNPTGRALLADLLKLREMGKEIYFISMAPFSRELSPDLLARDVRLAHLAGQDKTIEGDHAINRNKVDFLKKPAGVLMQKMANSIGAMIIDPLATLCSDTKCPYVKDGVPLYVDAHHIRASVTRTSATYIDALVETLSPPVGTKAAGADTQETDWKATTPRGDG